MAATSSGRPGCWPSACPRRSPRWPRWPTTTGGAGPRAGRACSPPSIRSAGRSAGTTPCACSWRPTTTPSAGPRPTTTCSSGPTRWPSASSTRPPGPPSLRPGSAPGARWCSSAPSTASTSLSRSTRAAWACWPATSSRPRPTAACRWWPSASCTGTGTSTSASTPAAGSTSTGPTSTLFAARSSGCPPGAGRSRCRVPVWGRDVFLYVWRADIGTVPLYLLDSDHPDNDAVGKWVTARLYDGSRDVRLAQYVVLGQGTVRMLDALGIEPGVIHLNEGHAALAALELARGAVEGGRRLRRGGRQGPPAGRLHHPHAPGRGQRGLPGRRGDGGCPRPGRPARRRPRPGARPGPDPARRPRRAGGADHAVAAPEPSRQRRGRPPRRGGAGHVAPALPRPGRRRRPDRPRHQRRARPDLAGAADAPAPRPSPGPRLARSVG